MCITSSVRELPKAISHWRWNVFIQKGNFLNLEHYLKRGLSYEMAISKKYCEILFYPQYEYTFVSILYKLDKRYQSIYYASTTENCKNISRFKNAYSFQ